MTNPMYTIAMSGIVKPTVNRRKRIPELGREGLWRCN
jgi:hypothetical protein